MDAPLQLALPFSIRDAVSVARAGAVLGVSRHTMYRLLAARVLESMQRVKGADLLIRHASLVAYCDGLRETFGLPDLRPELPNALFRHADRDIPPFPLTENLSVEDVMKALQLEKTRVITMANQQKIAAYQIAPDSPWRFYRPSLKAYLDNLHRLARVEPSARYAGWAIRRTG